MAVEPVIVNLFLHVQAQCVATDYCRDRKDFFDEDYTHNG